MLHAPLLAFGHDPKDHVLPHALVQVLDTNLHLPRSIFSKQVSAFWFTNHLLMTLVAGAVVLIVFTLVGQRYRLAMAGVPAEESVPRGFVGLIESVMDALRSGVVRPVLGADTDRFMPFLWTLFFFILTCNLLGMVPLEAVVRLLFKREHIGGTATGNVNVTGGLAVCAFFAIHASGILEVFKSLVAGTYGHHPHVESGEADETHGDHGHDAEPTPHGMAVPLAVLAAPVLYVWNFAPHVFKVQKHRPRPAIALRVITVPVYAVMIALLLQTLLGGLLGASVAPVGRGIGLALGAVAGLSCGGLHPLDLLDAAMWSVLFLLECIGAVVKPFALCMRLFANMIAGHIVLASILLLAPVFKGVTLGFLGYSLPIVLGCTALSCLEVFVAFLQAYIFMFLTTMFISASIRPEH